MVEKYKILIEQNTFWHYRKRCTKGLLFPAKPFIPSHLLYIPSPSTFLAILTFLVERVTLYDMIYGKVGIDC